jgi:xylan 1,4-beta-xylosidase
MKNKGRICIAVVFSAIFLLCLFQLQAIGTTTSPHGSSTATINIDCSAPRYTAKPMDGFLLSIGNQNPPDNVIKPLSPKYWRISSGTMPVLQRVESLGATPIFLMSDIYKYPASHLTGWISPRYNIKGWTDTIKHVFARHQAMGKRYIYDLWNEPNGKQFFDGSEADYHNVFKNAYDAIRAMPGGSQALISGPSISHFDTAFMHHFLDYCLKNNIQLDVLSWHEFRHGDDIMQIQQDIQWVRTHWVNGIYAPLHIKSIQINEIIPQSDQYTPATILAYFYYLEKGGADAACKGCWPPLQSGPNVKTNCFNNSLDGIIDPVTFSPRAAWWTYRYYNATLQNRFISVSNNKNVVSFASYNSDKLQLLVGYFGDQKPVDVNMNINLKNLNSIPALASRQTLNVKVVLIPNTGETVQDSLNTVYQTSVNASNSTVSFSLTKLKLKEAYYVEIY